MFASDLAFDPLLIYSSGTQVHTSIMNNMKEKKETGVNIKTTMSSFS